MGRASKHNGRDVRPSASSTVMALASLVVLGCAEAPSFVDDLDVDEFSPLVSFHKIDLSRLATPRDSAYLEVWQRTLSGVPYMALSYGEKCRDATNQVACAEGFDALVVSPSPGPCGSYLCKIFLIVNSGDDSFVVGGEDDQSSFFGAVDSPEEAMLVAASQRYTWNSASLKTGAYRHVDDGYQLIVTKMIESCNEDFHNVRNRYLLHIGQDASLVVLEEELFERRSGCID